MRIDSIRCNEILFEGLFHSNKRPARKVGIFLCYVIIEVFNKVYIDLLIRFRKVSGFFYLASADYRKVCAVLSDVLIHKDSVFRRRFENRLCSFFRNFCQRRESVYAVLANPCAYAGFFDARIPHEVTLYGCNLSSSVLLRTKLCMCSGYKERLLRSYYIS